MFVKQISNNYEGSQKLMVWVLENSENLIVLIMQIVGYP